LEDPNVPAGEDVYSRTTAPEDAPDEADILEVTFKDGVPVSIKNTTDGTVKTDPLELFLYANEIGGKHGVGRLDMVENRFVGIKSRGVYETPGGTIIHNALRDLEGLTMDREVMRLRDMFSSKFAELIYNGFWFSPEMDFLMAAIDQSQELIDGTVTVKLFKGLAYPIARTSPLALYDEKRSSMDEEGDFAQQDSEGFIKINAIRLQADTRIKKEARGLKKKNKAA